MAFKKLVIIIATMLAVVLLLIWANSFSIAMHSVGLLPNESTYSEYLADDDGRLLQVVQSKNGDGQVGLALLRRDAFGIWHVLDSDISDGALSMARVVWYMGSVWQKFDYPFGEEIQNYEWHYIYSADNATDIVRFLPEQIPDGAIVKIRQAGSLYWIHIVSYDTDSSGMFPYKIEEILKNNGCIS